MGAGIDEGRVLGETRESHLGRREWYWKTHLATALGIAACLAGKKVRFFRVTELITTLIEARDEKLLLRLRAQLAKQHLLILDELGYVPASKVGAELMFDIIGAA